MKKKWLTVLMTVLVMAGLVFTACPTDDSSGGGGGDSGIFGKDYDIIVVGAGIAGMSAALAAADGTDLQVLLIEKNSYPGGLSGASGGNFSSMLWGADTDDYTTWSNKYKDAMRNGMGGVKNDITAPEGRYPNYMKFYEINKDSKYTYNWLVDNGMAGLKDNPNASAGTPAFMGAVRMEALWDSIQDIPNIASSLNAKATELLYENTTPTKTVTGVKISFDGKSYNVKAKKVILASGGFSQSPELLEKYSAAKYGGYDLTMGWHFHNAPGRNSTGDGIVMAQAIGAGEYSAAYAEPWSLVFDPSLINISTAIVNYFDANASLGSPMRRNQQIIVDSDGIRWRPEDAFGYWVTSYTVYTRGKRAQLPVYGIFSEAHFDDTVTVQGTAISLGSVFDLIDNATGANAAAVAEHVVKGTSLADLATKLFGDGTTTLTAKAQAFYDTVAEYDEAVRKDLLGSGNPDYESWVDPLMKLSPVEIDAIGAEVVGGKARGTNGANLRRFGKDVVDGGGDYDHTDFDIKFYAIAARPSVWESEGGVPTDIYGRILTTELDYNSVTDTWETEGTASTIIKNLYGAGAISSRDYFNFGYHGGTSLTTFATIGRRAALHAIDAIANGE